jgi:hypothetical protein
MISDEQLDQYRVQSTIVRVIRDINTVNDVKGIVVAWDEDTVLIRKQNRRIVTLDRNYAYQPFTEARPPEFTLPHQIEE